MNAKAKNVMFEIFSSISSDCSLIYFAFASLFKDNFRFRFRFIVNLPLCVKDINMFSFFQQGFSKRTSNCDLSSLRIFSNSLQINGGICH